MKILNHSKAGSESSDSEPAFLVKYFVEK